MILHAKHSCPESVASAIDTLRGELLAHYGCDFAFTVMARGQLVSACNLKQGDVRPLRESPEEYADRREAEIDRANPLD
jgi:hypothetical protein